MKSDTCNLKKRKLFVAAVEDLGLPVPKHICCEAAVEYECDDVETLDTLVESTQDSNSFPGDSQSYAQVMFDDAGRLRKTDSCDEDVTSWANSRNDYDPFSLESRTLNEKGNVMEECQYPHQQNDDDIDVDCLDECLGTHYCKESKQQTAQELGEFCSSTGVDPTFFLLPSERWNVDQETQMSRRKPTIDQEFEQYFSTLML